MAPLEPGKGLPPPFPSLHIAYSPCQYHHKCELHVCFQSHPLVHLSPVPQGTGCIQMLPRCCNEWRVCKFQMLSENLSLIFNQPHLFHHNSKYSCCLQMRLLTFPPDFSQKGKSCTHSTNPLKQNGRCFLILTVLVRF